MLPAELLKIIFKALGISVILFAIFASAVLFLMLYPKAKLFISDVFRFFGWSAKIIRKKSIEAEIEGAINSFIKDFNSQLQYPFFPDCEVEWITAENQKSLIKPGKVIIRVNFDDDHDINFFNTTLSYAQTALLHRTKPFIKEITRRAIDLVTTKGIIKKTRKKVLQVFNEKFATENQETKELFFKLEETEIKGLFTRVFLQELHFLGETLGEKTPNIQIENEIEDFVDWFYKLATRETEERTDLVFGRTNIKVGVILVASEETYSKYGLEPYLRRAYSYASDEFDSIYIIARGKAKGDLSKKIAEELESKYGFEKLTKSIQLTILDKRGNKQFITCIALKPNLTTIIQSAWETIENKYNQKSKINVIIDAIEGDNIRVDTYGLKVFIDKSNLSELEITNPQKYFKLEQELLVTIKEFELERNKIILSNKGTETDPKKLVDLQLSTGEIHTAIVTKIKDSGLILRFNDMQIAGFIPRAFATFSQYVILSEKYSIDQEIQVKILNFNPSFDNFVCEPTDRIDPWSDFQYQTGKIYEVVIREIRERYITCEICEGVEGRIYIEELDWNSYDENKNEISQYNVGGHTNVFVLDINYEKNNLRLSVKRTFTNPILEFYSQNKNLIISTIVKKIIPSKGIEITTLENNFPCFIPMKEIMWCFCQELPSNIVEGSELNVRITDYDNFHNSIVCSLKRVEPNDYEIIISDSEIGNEILGELVSIGYDIIYLKLFHGKNYSFGYVHKSEISNINYISESDLKNILEPERKYHLIIKRFDNNNKIIEVSRKKYFLKNIQNVEYGIEYTGKIICKMNNYSLIHFDRFEAKLNSINFDLGDIIKTIVARKDEIIEVEIV